MRCRSVEFLILFAVCAAASACDSPSSPKENITGVIVTFPAGGTIFIGATAQLHAAETLTSGTTRAAAAVWSSDAPAVAAVSPMGLVTAVGAGEATITAETNALRGTLRIRVYPDFNGTWSGIESTVSCDDSGAFEGLCSNSDLYTQGELFAHHSSHTQMDTSVRTRIELGEDLSVSGQGTVTLDGELGVPIMRALPEDPEFKVDIDDLRLRADVPARLTGRYLARFTVAGVNGSIVLGIRLESVTRTAAVPTAAPRSTNAHSGAVGMRMARLRSMRLAQPQAAVSQVR